jgi:hypothetical protein
MTTRLCVFCLGLDGLNLMSWPGVRLQDGTGGTGGTGSASLANPPALSVRRRM